MSNFLIIAQILVALALIVVVTLQVKGGGLGGIFGQPDSVYRTRRGVEKSLFQMTIGVRI
jgi:preprotein translocase subunit SecG